MRRLRLAIALAGFAPLAAAAQGECEAPKNSNVAKMLAWFEGPLAFASHGPPRRLEAGAIVIAGDLTYLPEPSAAISQTDFCYAAKSENTGLAPVFPRPRVLLGLGRGVVVEAMYLPPVTVADATPNMGSVALSWTGAAFGAGRALDLTLRVHGTFGSVEGPITCPREALQQTGLPGCWGNTPSNDRYSPNSLGADVGLATRTSGRLDWYGGVGILSLRPRFQVNFTYLNGTPDRAKVRVDLMRVSAHAGASYDLSPRVALSAQLYSVPADATTGRAGLSWRLR